MKMGVVVLVLAGLGAAGLIWAIGATAQGTPAAALTLTAKPKGDKLIDELKMGPSIGDQVLEHGTLADAVGKRAGSYQMSSQLVSGGTRHGRELSQFSLQLGAGELTLAGGHGTVEKFTLPIAGGTGTYVGASGTASFRPAGHGKTTLQLQFAG